MFGQGDRPDPYHVNYWISAPLTIGGLVLSQIAIDEFRDKPGISEADILRISNKGVSGFDKWGLEQDVTKVDDAAKFSDLLMSASLISPLLLFLDKEIRPTYLKVLTIYFEAQSINSLIYGYSPVGPRFIDRYRPALYYDELPLEERSFGNIRNSFFSGHVSTVATSTFFLAKVYSDYHPDAGKFLSFGLAAIPPAIVGIYRIKALKHFPSDVVVGYVIGAATGILIPEIHRKSGSKIGVSAVYTRSVKGIALRYRPS